MAPTETQILTSFLLAPAPLPSLLSLKAFTALFPRNQQSSPQINLLYRDLQRQRSSIIDLATKNIIEETKRGNAQRRVVVRARRAAEREEVDDEVDVEMALFGSTSNLPITKPHSLKSIIPEMEAAVEDIEDEIRRMDEESEQLLEEMRGIVGGLSDLRYGRFANGQLRNQVLEGLERLEKTCEKT